MAEAEARGLPFQEAIDYLQSKVRLPTQAWTDLWQGMHARAFVVAGAVKAELIADFHAAVVRAIAEGRTLADFRKDFERIVAAHGWSYRGSPGWRSAVIYNTNMRMAHASGRWAQVQRLKGERPYLRYSAVLDSRTRPLHREWHGTILPVDHAWWRTHFPPNGWYCRCTAVSVSESDLKRRGWKVAAAAPDAAPVPHQVNTPQGPVTIQVPEGIDPGFAYNAGEAAWGRGASSLAMERHGPWEALEAPGGSSPAEPGPLPPQPFAGTLARRTKEEHELRGTLRRAIGGDEVVFADPTGERALVGQALVDHMLADPRRLDGREAFFPLIPELVQRPAEIWVGFAKSTESGRTSMRRRYIQLFDLGRGRAATLVCDFDAGQWSGLTFIPGDLKSLKGVRSGLRIYRS